MNAPAKRAQFDRSAQHRRSMYAKINIARQQLNLAEDDYRQMLFDATGEVSLKDCNERQLEAMIALLKSKGFQPLPKAGGKSAANHPTARKARALWISLYQLGVVHNPSEKALEAFAKRQLKCDRLVWARQSHGFRLIEALKSMGERAGWTMHDRVRQKPLDPIGLKRSLCNAILAKLKEAEIAPTDWHLGEAAWKLCGIENAKDHGWTASDYEQLADALGAKLRDFGKGQS